jgi:hypothetical protein
MAGRKTKCDLIGKNGFDHKFFFAGPPAFSTGDAAEIPHAVNTTNVIYFP